MRKLVLSSLLALAAVANVFGQCEPSHAVRIALDKFAAVNANLTMKERREVRAAILNEALDTNPGDYFLLRRMMRSEDKRADQMEWARRVLASHPNDPVYRLLNAMAMLGTNTTAAIEMMENLKSTGIAARVHAELAGVFEYGKFKNQERARKEADAFLKLCPAPLEAASINLAARSASPASLAAMTTAVRKRLEAEDGALLTEVWEALWAAEFKARPVPEHEALRKQIVQDLSRLESSPKRQELSWIAFLKSGYESAGDKAVAKRLEDEVLAKYPKSRDAREIIDERWREERPFPQKGSAAEKEAHAREGLSRVQGMLKTWPDDSLLRADEFNLLRNSATARPEDVVKSGETLLASYRRNPNWHSTPPVEFRIAAEFVKHRANMDQVTELVERSYQAAVARRQEQLDDDRTPADIRRMMDQSRSFLEIERARVLIDYYAATKQPARIPEIESRLAAIKFEKDAEKATLFEVRGKAAEAADRKLDALLFYRSALTMRSQPPRPPAKDTLPGDIERLFKELDGTAASYTLVAEKAAKAAGEESRWERATKPIPSFVHTDLEGKTWKLASLEGKTVLINLWATWCGPCRMEHPEFQKLYESLKGRTDVAVISFNLDDDLGKVAPYMKENKYTFPALLARETVDAVLEGVGIPQNWFVNSKGKLEWLQVGFGNEPNWREMMLAKLDEMAKSR